MLPYNNSLVQNSRTLRKNMTAEERLLWYNFLKLLPINVRRQHVIENFIVDFYIASKKIAIEIDGIQHQTPEHVIADKERDSLLAKWGITVLRYNNQDVNRNFNAVSEDILKHLGLSPTQVKGF